MVITTEFFTNRLREDLQFHRYTIIEHTIRWSAQYVVAVKGTALLFLRARKYKRNIRRSEVVVSLFGEDIQDLAEIRFENCQRQFWIYTEKKGWKRFIVNQDGTIEEVEQWWLMK